MTLSPLQARGLDAVGRWLANGYDESRPDFLFTGFAGSGKTTVAKMIAELANGRVEFCAFTGKAAHVLQQKGCHDARTIHQLFYLVGGERVTTEQIDKLKTTLRELLDKPTRTPADDPEIDALRERIRMAEQQSMRGGPRFTLNPVGPAHGAKLIIADECSMIDRRMAEDMLSIRVPILWLGDPAQLPPVGGSSFFRDRDPDFHLDEIHRQALDSPIIWLADRIRQRERVMYGSHGDVEIVKWMPGRVDEARVVAADQVIVGRNRTRVGTNAKIRRLRGFGEGEEPAQGDRLICLRNNYDAGLINGGIWNADKVEPLTANRIALSAKSVDHGGMYSGTVWSWPFKGSDEKDQQCPEGLDSFTFGYAITCHKSQGSQYDDVVVFDESRQFSEPHKWLYTAVTRAARRLMLAIP